MKNGIQQVPRNCASLCRTSYYIIFDWYTMCANTVIHSYTQTILSSPHHTHRTVAVVLFVCSNVTSFFIWMLFAQCEKEKCVRNVPWIDPPKRQSNTFSCRLAFKTIDAAVVARLHILRANEWNLNTLSFSFYAKRVTQHNCTWMNYARQLAYANERHTPTNASSFFCVPFLFHLMHASNWVYIRRKSMLPNPYTPTSYFVLMKARLPHANAHSMSASVYHTDRFC